MWVVADRWWPGSLSPPPDSASEPDVVAHGWPRTSPEAQTPPPAATPRSSSCSPREAQSEQPAEEALPYRLRAVRAPYTPAIPGPQKTITTAYFHP